MSTKFYIDSNNVYLGAFEGTTGKVPTGSIEVPLAPTDARFKWDGEKWIEPPELKDQFTDEKRQSEYIKQGVTDKEKLDALWDHVVNAKSTAVDELKAKIEAVDASLPKP